MFRLLSVFLSLVPTTHAADPPPGRPNIVFILADDIGYGDLGPYGATKVKTPHCDRLAREGVRLTDAHSSASVCTPTRYAFVTGQYAWRNPAGSRILTGEAPLSIKAGTPTVASVLKAAGYTTGFVGKWHLGLGDGSTKAGPGPDWNGEIRPGPLELGFDSAFFLPATGDRVPCVYVDGHRVVGLDPADPIRVSFAAKVGDEPTGHDRPDLLTVMRPSHGHDQTIVGGISRIGFMSGGKAARWKDEEMGDTFAAKAVAFLEASRNPSRPFFLSLSTHAIHVPRVPHPRFRGTSGAGTRGDAIHEFDATVGAVLAALDRLGLAENTLIVVTSDNGGVLDDGYEDGSGQDTSGHRPNGALRGFKGSIWEGGHRVPFLARWPGRIAAGSRSDALVGSVDMLATFAAVAGAPLPPGASPDGVDVSPALLKPGSPGRDSLVHQAGNPDVLALRRGPWKLIPGRPGAAASKAAAKKNADAPPGRDQLYQLADDPGESRDFAASEPARVAEMTAILKRVTGRP